MPVRNKRQRKITNNDARWAAEKLDINLKVLKLPQWKQAMQVELEHGKHELVRGKTNVTDDDILLTAQIALAHILEFPDYYDRLEKLEERAKKYWKNKKHPNVFL